MAEEINSIEKPSIEFRRAHEVLDFATTEAAGVIRLPEEDLFVAVAAPLVGEHVVYEGEPGTAKTLLAKTNARIIGGSFKRVQGAPDVMPKEITGYHEYNPVTGERHFRKGPIFATVTLVDEANRLSTRSQAGVLEAMQEKQVTVGGETYKLEEPSIVITTENPEEYADGVNRDTKAFTDRHTASVYIPEYDVDDMIAIRKLVEKANKVNRIVSDNDLVSLPELVNRVRISDELLWKADSIVVAVRTHKAVDSEQSVLKQQRPFDSVLKIAQLAALGLGEGPRSKVSGHDIEIGARFALPHRMGLKFEAEAKTTKQDVIAEAIERVNALAKAKASN